MRKKFKLFIYFTLLFIATTAGAQTATTPFDPFHPDLPIAQVSWVDGRCKPTFATIEKGFIWGMSAYRPNTTDMDTEWISNGEWYKLYVKCPLGEYQNNPNPSVKSKLELACEYLNTSCREYEQYNPLECKTWNGKWFMKGEQSTVARGYHPCGNGYPDNKDPPQEIRDAGCKQIYETEKQNIPALPINIRNVSDAEKVCNYASAEKASDFWCFSGGVAADIRRALRKQCYQTFEIFWERLKNTGNECYYLQAKRTGIDLAAGLDTWGFNEYDTQIDQCYNKGSRGNLLGGTPCPMNCGSPGSAYCTRDVWAIDFELVLEPGCYEHEVGADVLKGGSSARVCRTCYEDRKNEGGDIANPKGDLNSSPKRDEALYPGSDPIKGPEARKAGGYIRSQGCLPQSGTRKLGSIGGGSGGALGTAAKITDVLKSGNINDIIDIMLPPCIFDPFMPEYYYPKFEGYDPDLTDSDKKNHNNPNLPQPNCTPKAAEVCPNSLPGCTPSPAITCLGPDPNLQSKQQLQVYNVIDEQYKDHYSDKDDAPTKFGAYKGNCGRGKFFYKNRSPQDSNIIPITNSANPNYSAEFATEFNDMRASSNDIWESRTGCYNPEERFVVMPIGQVIAPATNKVSATGTPGKLNRTYDATEINNAIRGPIKYFEPRRVVGEGFKDYGAYTVTASTTDPEFYAELYDYTANAANPFEDMLRPFDSPEIEETTPNSGKFKDIKTGRDVIDTTQTSNWLVPDDRILMRHPMCIARYTSGFNLRDPNTGAIIPPTTAQLGATFLNRAKTVNTLITPEDKKRVKEGFLPICMADDILDDADDFCSNYFRRANEKFDIVGIDFPLTKANYINKRYVFDTKDFCWKSNIDTALVEFDPYEHYLPPALFGGISSGGTNITRPDFFGAGNHIYLKTDFLRPHQTDYAARVVRDLGGSKYYHNLQSLEEYGYRNTPVPRKDYQYNPFNIYAPNAIVSGRPQIFTRDQLTVKANMGRKAKMQKCLRLYIEQWAFEGDKGYVVLDRDFENRRIIRNETIKTAPDSSMCQWVAYYNTSDNDINSNEISSNRNAFKAVMISYFSAYQQNNKEYINKFITDTNKKKALLDAADLGFIEIVAGPIRKPLFTTSTSMQNFLPGVNYDPDASIIDKAMYLAIGSATASAPGTDPERFKGSTTNLPLISKDPSGDFVIKTSNLYSGWGSNMDIKIPAPPGNSSFSSLTELNIGSPLNNMYTDRVDNVYEKGFRRARGMRPEIFDYYNFLSFSALSVMYEGFDLTNNASVGNGSPIPGKLESYKDLASLGSLNLDMLDSLYTPRIDTDVLVNNGTGLQFKPDFLVNALNSVGWQANLEKRNCNSVIPPHFWKDVVKPFAGCSFVHGAENINDLAFSLDRSSAIGKIAAIGIDFVLDGVEKVSEKFLNTTYRHWMTTDIDKPILSLLTPIPGLPTFAIGLSYEGGFYAKTKFEKFELAGSSNSPVYIEDTWLGRADGKPILKDKLIEQVWSKPRWYENTTYDTATSKLTDEYDIGAQKEYGKYQFSFEWGKNRANYVGGFKEVAKIVNKNLMLGTIIIDEKDIKNFSLRSRDWVDHTWPASSCMHMNPIDVPSFLIGDLDLLSFIKKTSYMKQLSDIEGDAANVNIATEYLKLSDSHIINRDVKGAWKVKDDIDTSTISIFRKNTPDPSRPEDEYVKNMGGFKIRATEDEYFEWLPSSWSIAVGLNKAFWCEFEVPYNPYFTGDDHEKFHKTDLRSHFAINSARGMVFEEPVPKDSKPKLQLYRVERIRDACGPFGVRSTWLEEDPSGDLIAFLMGKDARDPKTQSRCGGWLDMYRKYQKDPKIIAWRLPRFDYEFLKAFFECTGPKRDMGPNPCRYNEPAYQENMGNAVCEGLKGILNTIVLIAIGKGPSIETVWGPIKDKLEKFCAGPLIYDPDSGQMECKTFSALDILKTSTASIISTLASGLGIPYVPNIDSECLAIGGFKSGGETWNNDEKLIDNFIRMIDYATRGDFYYGLDREGTKANVNFDLDSLLMLAGNVGGDQLTDLKNNYEKLKNLENNVSKIIKGGDLPEGKDSADTKNKTTDTINKVLKNVDHILAITGNDQCQDGTDADTLPDKALCQPDPADPNGPPKVTNSCCEKGVVDDVTKAIKFVKKIKKAKDTLDLVQGASKLKVRVIDDPQNTALAIVLADMDPKKYYFKINKTTRAIDKSLEAAGLPKPEDYGEYKYLYSTKDKAGTSADASSYSSGLSFMDTACKLTPETSTTADPTPQTIETIREQFYNHFGRYKDVPGETPLDADKKCLHLPILSSNAPTDLINKLGTNLFGKFPECHWGNSQPDYGIIGSNLHGIIEGNEAWMPGSSVPPRLDPGGFLIDKDYRENQLACVIADAYTCIDPYKQVITKYSAAIVAAQPLVILVGDMLAEVTNIPGIKDVTKALIDISNAITWLNETIVEPIDEFANKSMLGMLEVANTYEKSCRDYDLIKNAAGSTNNVVNGNFSLPETILAFADLKIVAGQVTKELSTPATKRIGEKLSQATEAVNKITGPIFDTSGKASGMFEKLEKLVGTVCPTNSQGANCLQDAIRLLGEAKTALERAKNLLNGLQGLTEGLKGLNTAAGKQDCGPSTCTPSAYSNGGISPQPEESQYIPEGDGDIGDPLFGLEGFRDPYKHSTQLQEYWLYEDNTLNKKYAANDPFGFWCNCPVDDPKTTRCREDFCTVDQHVLLAGRNAPLLYKFEDLITKNIEIKIFGTTFGGKGGDQLTNECKTRSTTDCEECHVTVSFLNNTLICAGPCKTYKCIERKKVKDVQQEKEGLIRSLTTPVAIAKGHGPFKRWLQCYYQARSKACPVLTRDVSDTPAYSTLVDPFPADRKFQPEMAQKTGKGQNFNVCNTASPTGIGDEKLDQFLRWSKEEPNHLARVPVAFESAGGGFKHQDFVFYTQTRDYEAPFMELAVPFPIDLITRYEASDGVPEKSSDEDEHLKFCDSENIKASGVFRNPLNGNMTSGKFECDRQKINALGEINQREGTNVIQYDNPRSPLKTTQNPVVKQYSPLDIKDATGNLVGKGNNEYDLNRIYQDGFRSSLLFKSNTARIEPSSDEDWNNLAYSSLYIKYLKGLYAAKKAFDYNTEIDQGKTSEPALPMKKYISDYTINPRAEDTVVGPRGCDIGGWYEMMLYQARCIRWFKLNCICDYDKTFARGNAQNYALKKAGMTFKAIDRIKVGEIYKQTPAVDRFGQIIKIYRKDDVVSPTGEPKPEVSNFGIEFGSMNKRDEFGKLITDNSIVGVSGIDLEPKDVTFPLSDRGYLGPEFATRGGATPPSPDKFRISNLDNVRVGDLIYWDETITKTVNGRALDVGYPRHMAYVDKVNRVRVSNVSSTMVIDSIVVSEMNWGKNLDSCGNTDMWGRVSQRTIKNPNLSLDGVTVTEIVPLGIGTLALPYPVKVKGPKERYASCRNADWAVCVEEFWDQVKIYRPYEIEIARCGNQTKVKTALTDPLYRSNYTTTAANSCVTNDFPLPQPLTHERVLSIASGIVANTSITKPSGFSDMVGNLSAAVANSVTARANFESATTPEVKSKSEEVYTNAKQDVIDKRQDLSYFVRGNFSSYQIYETDLWKLLSPQTDVYPYDEVDNFLNNPLFGTADRCDPPAYIAGDVDIKRDNFDEVLEDTRLSKAVKDALNSDRDWDIPEDCTGFAAGPGTGAAAGQTCTVPSDCASNSCVANVCQGNLPSGSSCGSNVQCASNVCESGMCKGSTGSVCLDADNKDAPSHCITGQCSGGVCQKSQAGGACQKNAECATGTTCINDTCTASAGGTCDFTTDCNEDSLCNLYGACEPASSFNQITDPRTNQITCIRGNLGCAANECRSDDTPQCLSANNQTCPNGSDGCLAGECRKGMCEEITLGQPNGAFCKKDPQCLSDNCLNNKCVASINGTCTKPEDCSSKNCADAAGEACTPTSSNCTCKPARNDLGSACANDSECEQGLICSQADDTSANTCINKVQCPPFLETFEYQAHIKFNDPDEIDAIKNTAIPLSLTAPSQVEGSECVQVGQTCDGSVRSNMGWYNGGPDLRYLKTNIYRIAKDKYIYVESSESNMSCPSPNETLSCKQQNINYTTTTTSLLNDLFCP